MYAISALQDPQRFYAQWRCHHLGSVVLAEARSSSVRYLRSVLHVARGAYDHYQITFNFSGEVHYRSGRHSVIARAGDIVIVDNARETDAYVHAPDGGSAHQLALFVPRAALAPLRRVPGAAHLLLLSHERPLARSVHEHLSQLLEAIGLESPAAVRARTQEMIALLAGGVGAAGPLAPTMRRTAHRSAAESLERFIEWRLDSPALSVALL
ncbi:MAG: hypothetical protein ACREUG_07315, partial [Steroidobacteraceae bacterium]